VSPPETNEKGPVPPSVSANRGRFRLDPPGGGGGKVLLIENEERLLPVLMGLCRKRFWPEGSLMVATPEGAK